MGKKKDYKFIKDKASLFLSIIAITISLGSLYLGFQEVQLLKEQTIFTNDDASRMIKLECEVSREPARFTFVYNNKYGFLKVPVACTLSNIGSKSFSVAKIKPILFKQDFYDNNLSLDRGSEDEMLFDIFWDNNIPYDLNITLPFEVKERSVKKFNSSVAIPIWFSSNHGNNGLYFKVIKGFSDNQFKMYETLGTCLTSPKKNNCFNTLVGKPLVNYLYEGADFPSERQGLTINGAGIKIILFNNFQIIKEVDLRKYSDYTPNKKIRILNEKIKYREL